MSRRALIIGSSGLVAPILSRKLQGAGWRVFLTSRSDTAEIRFDLARPDPGVLPADIDAVFLIAAETSLRRCENEPEATYGINVLAPAAIAQLYASVGAHVLTLSTTLVFDGSAPFMSPVSARHPACMYGKQKADLEDALMRLPAPVTVLRITKIVESLERLATDWSRDLLAAKPIKPFIDLVCAPVSLSRVVEILAYSTEHRLPGLYQHSGDRDIDYAEIARMLCRRMKLGENLIEPCRSAGLQVPPIAVPAHTTLDEAVPSGFAPQQPEDISVVLAGFFHKYRPS